MDASELQALAGQAPLPTMVRGFNIDVYAYAPAPEKLTPAPNGALYVGQPGGVDRILRVSPGGRSVLQYGPPLVDPDAVLFDAGGRISGVKNSVLVGGGRFLSAIFPDQTAAVIFDSGFVDVDDMKFDRTGRLVFADDGPEILATTGGTPAVLFHTPDGLRPGSLAISQDNLIYVALADGSVRVWHPNGAPAGIFATGLATGLNTFVVFGAGGGFGRFLYVLSGSDLLRFTPNGKATRIGTGFNSRVGSGIGFVFGADGALYVSDTDQNRILRISRGTGR